MKTFITTVGYDPKNNLVVLGSYEESIVLCKVCNGVIIFFKNNFTIIIYYSINNNLNTFSKPPPPPLYIIS
jgi:hypothetical protein